MANNMNSKDYRDTVLTYIEKLGEIDKLKDEFFTTEGNKDELRQKIDRLTKETNELKKEIDNHKRNRVNERN
jgi:peptidoglycan hydrolase CwlO-like protein